MIVDSITRSYGGQMDLISEINEAIKRATDMGYGEADRRVQALQSMKDQYERKGNLTLSQEHYLKSLLRTLSLLEVNFLQSFLSLSVSLLFNYVCVSINSQFKFFDLMSFENFHVSYTFLIFWGSPDKILLSLSLMQEIISLTKSTVTSKMLLFV